MWYNFEREDAGEVVHGIIDISVFERGFAGDSGHFAEKIQNRGRLHGTVFPKPDEIAVQVREVVNKMIDFPFLHARGSRYSQRNIFSLFQ